VSLTSIVIPVYNEGEALVPYLDAVLASTTDPREILIVHDMPEDSTVPVVAQYELHGEPVRAVLNTHGPGPAHAIRYGIESSNGDAVVVTMADGSDDPTQIDLMAEMIRSGYVIVAASRYMRGGRQLGGPIVKRTLSRLAGVSLGVLGRVGTMDATSSFKAYAPGFVRDVGIESTEGFEVAIELVAKARRTRRQVTEIPTTWRDRTEGRSRFRTAAWIPHYLRWYFFAFGPPIRQQP
jgi:dolichol-phosphate mannosyltransferase